MDRRKFMQMAALGSGVIFFTPAEIFANRLFLIKDEEEIINLTPNGPVPVADILGFFRKIVNAVRAVKVGYDSFKEEYGRLNDSYYSSSWQTKFNDIHNYSRFNELAFPVYRQDRTLVSGSNNYIMPVVGYGGFNDFDTKTFVCGPHMVGLGMIAEGMRKRTGSSSKTANKALPVGGSNIGDPSFKVNSTSKFRTEDGDVQCIYRDKGFGEGTIEAKITHWDEDEGRTKNENVRMDVTY